MKEDTLTDTSECYLIYAKQPIGKTTIAGLGELNPLQDITPLEAVHLSIMLTIICNSHANLDYEPYADEHNLRRHFKATT